MLIAHYQHMKIAIFRHFIGTIQGKFYKAFELLSEINPVIINSININGGKCISIQSEKKVLTFNLKQRNRYEVKKLDQL
jgi:hypothetical protein